MSTLSVDTITKADGSGSLSVPAESGTVVTTASPSLGRRNLIINGAMQVAQRGASVTGITSSGYYSVDRMYTQNATSSFGTWTESQSTDAPDGFSNSFKILCTAADASPAASDYKFASYRFEGQDLQQLAFGTSSAKTITLSFWVKSNKTGTYTTSLQNFDSNRQIGSTYTVDSADTWEKKVLTFEGDQTGSFDNDNTVSMQIDWWLGAGTDWSGAGSPLSSWGASTTNARAGGLTVNLADTVNNYWQLTGVQLEVGSVATPFEHRSYGEELALCQRYFYKMTNGANQYFMSGHYYSTTLFAGTFSFPVTMRTAPTFEYVSGSSYYGIYSAGSFDGFDAMNMVRAHINGGGIDTSTGTSGTVGNGGAVTTNDSNAHISFNAEL